MCYRCQVCRQVTEPGASEKKWPIYKVQPEKQVITEQHHGRHGGVYTSTRTHQRQAKQLERELRVCANCYKNLSTGVDVNDLIRQGGEVRRPEPNGHSAIRSSRRRLVPLASRLQDDEDGDDTLID